MNDTTIEEARPESRMVAEILTTPESNINPETNSVIDNEKNRKLTLDWGHEVIIFDTKATAPTPEIRPIAVEHLSTFDHRLMVQGEKYRALHMFSKNRPYPKPEEEEAHAGY